MKISKLNSQSILVEKAGTSFIIPYFYSWNNTIKNPECVVLKENGSSIGSYFLTSIIEDSITERENGFYIDRFWNIVPEGNVGLSFCIDLVSPEKTPYLIPCMLEGEDIDRENIHILGERLTHPSGAYLFPEGKGIYLATDIPKQENQFSSLSLRRIRVGKYNCIRMEYHLPPYEELPEEILSRGYIHGRKNCLFQSASNLKQRLGLNVIISEEKTIYPLSLSLIHDNARDKIPVKVRMNVLNSLRQGMEKCQSEYLFDQKGVVGLIKNQNQGIISSRASSGAALLIQKLYKKNEEMQELSLKLADFCLKGQHPRGPFFGEYNLKNRSWLKKETLDKLNREETSILEVPIKTSALISHNLLRLAGELKELGLGYSRYFLSGKRFVDSLFTNDRRLETIGSYINLGTMEPVKENLHCLYFLFPLFTLFGLTEDNTYKKAMLLLKENFFPSQFTPYRLPGKDPGSLPEAETAILLLKSANLLEQIGSPVEDKEGLINIVLPWINYNVTKDMQKGDIIGGIVDSYDRCRIIFHSYELAYHLLVFKKNLADSGLGKAVEEGVKDLISFGSQKDCGIPGVQHTLWAPGGETGKLLPPFDTLSFADEALHLYNIHQEFPDYLD